MARVDGEFRESSEACGTLTLRLTNVRSPLEIRPWWPPPPFGIKCNLIRSDSLTDGYLIYSRLLIRGVGIPFVNIGTSSVLEELNCLKEVPFMTTIGRSFRVVGSIRSRRHNSWDFGHIWCSKIVHFFSDSNFPKSSFNGHNVVHPHISFLILALLLDPHDGWHPTVDDRTNLSFFLKAEYAEIQAAIGLEFDNSPGKYVDISEPGRSRKRDSLT